jgi:hypothetical protein
MSSTIDITKPATGSQLLSADIRNNFIAAKNDIESLQANQHFKGVFTTLTALQTAIPTALAGDYAQVDAGTGTNLQTYMYDLQEGWVVANSTGSGASNTDGLPEGSINVYFTASRVLSTLLNLFSATTGTITSADTVFTAIEKLAGNLAVKLTANTAITAATKTKITYDANGLVTAGSDATTADIADSTNKRYVTDAEKALITSLASQLNPVGTIREFNVATNPATLLGFGTWSAFGTGRVTVAIDAAQAEFDTNGETGGAKTHTLTTTEMPAHSHTLSKSVAGSFYINTFPSNGGWVHPATGTGYINVNGDLSVNNTGGDGAHNNLQPYIVVYRWLRTA